MTDPQPIILASTSAVRRAMLASAGVPHSAMSAGVDEEAARAALRADGLHARDLADALAALKAMRIAARFPSSLVLGCDQTLALDDGTMFDKPVDRETAAAQLALLSGKRHTLFSAAVMYQNGRAVWRHVDAARLEMRPLSEAFISAYLDREYENCRGCVGCYQIEGPGVQLFRTITGSHFTILGLPLLALLDYLRVRGIIAT